MKKVNIFGKIIGEILRFMGVHKFKVRVIPDNPVAESVSNNVLYLVGTDEYLKWAYLKCPCGCGDVIMLSLNKDRFPSWHVISDNIGRPSVSPSIFRKEGCGSHFWIRKGNVKWSYDEIDLQTKH